MLAVQVRLPVAARAASALTSFCSGAAHAMLLQTPRGLPTHMSVTCLQQLSPLNVLHAAPLASGTLCICRSAPARIFACVMCRTCRVPRAALTMMCLVHRLCYWPFSTTHQAEEVQLCGQRCCSIMFMAVSTRQPCQQQHSRTSWRRCPPVAEQHCSFSPGSGYLFQADMAAVQPPAQVSRFCHGGGAAEAAGWPVQQWPAGSQFRRASFQAGCGVRGREPVDGYNAGQRWRQWC